LKLIFVYLCSISVICFSAQTKNDRQFIELILDASASMMSHTESGELKIIAAKKAIQELVDNLPPETIMALRAYGNQSPKDEKDCRDTQLLSGFSSLSDNRKKILYSLEELEAKGLTPITYVINLASRDFPEETGVEKKIILLNGGKETCKGDPCIEALNIIKKEEIDPVIQCIGFGVDQPTQKQLECIASVTGGQYFSASNKEDLIEKLNKAIKAEVIKVQKEKGPGWLKVEGADISGHNIIEAKTGKKVGEVDNVNNTIELPAGIYNVTIANSKWKSIEVKAGEKNVLGPGWLEVKNAAVHGHKVLEKETGEEFSSVSRFNSTITILPGEYKIMFGLLSREIKIKKGKTTVINPGIVKVIGARQRGHPIFNESGEKIGRVSHTRNWIPLPHGKYIIDLDGQKINFELKEGQEKIFERK